MNMSHSSTISAWLVMENLAPILMTIELSHNISGLSKFNVLYFVHFILIINKFNMMSTLCE